MLKFIKPQDRTHLDFDVWKREKLKDPEIKAEYDKLQPEIAAIRAIIEARINKKITPRNLMP